MPRRNTDGSRARGGILRVAVEDGRVTRGEYIREPEPVPEGVNVAGAVIDFGAVRSNGAFRLLHPKRGDWTLVPLPYSLPFTVELDTRALGLPAGKSLTGVEPIEPEAGARKPILTGRGGVVSLQADGLAFGYRLKVSE